MKNGTSYSIQGNWQGRYFYKTRAEAFAFEAVFIEINGRVEGNILDAGRLGEAVVAGTFGYPSLEFTKRYYQETRGGPVRYRGTMSEDGKMLSGTWQLASGTAGTWLAVRTDDIEELKFEEWEYTHVGDEVYEPQTAGQKSQR